MEPKFTYSLHPIGWAILVDGELIGYTAMEATLTGLWSAWATLDGVRGLVTVSGVDGRNAAAEALLNKLRAQKGGVS